MGAAVQRPGQWQRSGHRRVGQPCAAGGGGTTSGAAAVAVGPNGKTVYVSGFGGGVRTHANFATIAYNAATGACRWVSHFNGPGSSAADGAVIAISPRGRIVYITGTINNSGSDYATVAYHAATGTQIWARLYKGIIPGGVNLAAAIAASRVAPEVVVTGSSDGGITGVDYATVACNTGTGAQLWVMRSSGPGDGIDFARAIAISRAGTIYITGESQGTTTRLDYATIAYQG